MLLLHLPFVVVMCTREENKKENVQEREKLKATEILHEKCLK